MKKILKKLIPDFILYWYHWKLALLGAVVFGFPSWKLKVIGVTGTKGKSTVVYLAGRILNIFLISPGDKITPSQSPPYQGGEKMRAGWISSLTINDGVKEMMNPYHMTMPGRFFIQQTLRQMVKNGCEYALVEVTSEGIKQSRHRFINWLGAVFTNLAPEHLEAHGGFEKYRAAKAELFKATSRTKNSFGVYNLDDENAQYFLKYEVKNKYGYTLKNNFQFSIFNFQSILKCLNIQLNANGSEFEINGVKFKTNLLGEFNVYNCAAASAIGLACGVPLEKSAETLAKIKSIPGRLEIIDEGQNFQVVVDLAHTPDSFSQVFGLFKALPHNKIISVFGSAGGGRDKWKRPELGRIAGENSDMAIICNEDPYNENPRTICEEIAIGCKNIKPEIILDRRQAIARVMSLAQPGDIVLVLGKGTEQTYVEGNKKIHWDDREAVREELRKLKI